MRTDGDLAVLGKAQNRLYSISSFEAQLQIRRVNPRGIKQTRGHQIAIFPLAEFPKENAIKIVVHPVIVQDLDGRSRLWNADRRI